MLANIFQFTHDLRTEVHNLHMEIRDLRTDFSTRLEAVEAQLARQPTIQSASNVTADLPQDFADGPALRHDNLARQEEDLTLEDIVTQEDVTTGTREDNIVHDDEDLSTHTQQDVVVTQEDARTYEEDHAHEDAVTHTHEDREKLAREDGQGSINSSSPSVDGGITVVTQPVVPAPAAGIKRKRTVRHTPAYINRSGFMIRSSDDQIAEKRNGEAEGPSRLESPFDNNDDRDDSSDGVDEIPPKPPVRPQLPPSTSTQTVPPRRPRAKEAGLDEFVAPKAEDFTISRHGRIRRQTQRPLGFVATPDFKKAIKKSR
ncbi:hypothetical protein KCU73_g8006, partial [Aureobasidium melanogenum]